jgi:Outer membrane protein beta-barrel domain
LSKVTVRMLPLAVLLLAGASQANAQGVSAYFGLGSAWNSAATSSGCPSGQIGDPFSPTTPAPCVPVSSMGGVFGVFGADFMIKPHLGINGEYSFRFAQADYLTSNSFSPPVPVKVRPAFYDFNAVYQPGSGDKRIVPVLEGGIGGAKLSFYATQAAGSAFSSSQFFLSSNHFQLHGAVGVKLYFKSDIFLKPQFDIHYVPNLTNQYGRNFVPRFTISIGYSFGRQ